jgi:hypothetical protein
MGATRCTVILRGRVTGPQAERVASAYRYAYVNEMDLDTRKHWHASEGTLSTKVGKVNRCRRNRDYRQAQPFSRFHSLNG